MKRNTYIVYWSAGSREQGWTWEGGNKVDDDMEKGREAQKGRGIIKGMMTMMESMVRKEVGNGWMDKRQIQLRGIRGAPLAPFLFFSCLTPNATTMPGKSILLDFPPHRKLALHGSRRKRLGKTIACLG